MRLTRLHIQPIHLGIVVAKASLSYRRRLLLGFHHFCQERGQIGADFVVVRDILCGAQKHYTASQPPYHCHPLA